MRLHAEFYEANVEAILSINSPPGRRLNICRQRANLSLSSGNARRSYLYTLCGAITPCVAGTRASSRNLTRAVLLAARFAWEHARAEIWYLITRCLPLFSFHDNVHPVCTFDRQILSHDGHARFSMRFRLPAPRTTFGTFDEFRKCQSVLQAHISDE